MQTVVEMAGFNVLRGFTGHGVGEEMHQPPNIPCYGEKGKGVILKEGMTLAIEPLVTTGDYEVEYKPGSDWETVLTDGSDFAQFEHTVIVTNKGAEIITKS
jgi:methionyl aminopeptidase